MTEATGLPPEPAFLDRARKFPISMEARSLTEYIDALRAAYKRLQERERANVLTTYRTFEK